MTIRIGGGSPVSGGGSPDGSQHTVKKGETLQSIADQYGVPAEDLAKNNPQLKNPEKIRAGTKMFIPPFSQAAGDGSVLPAPKDSFESAVPKSSLDKMMEAPAGRVFSGESKSFKNLEGGLPSGESKAFNFGKGEAPIGKKVTATEALSDKAFSGESRAFNFGKGEAPFRKKVTTSEASKTPGESQAFNFGKGEAPRGKKVTATEAQAQKTQSGEIRSWGDPHTEPLTPGPEKSIDGGGVKKLAPDQFVIKDGKVFIKGEE